MTIDVLPTINVVHVPVIAPGGETAPFHLCIYGAMAIDVRLHGEQFCQNMLNDRGMPEYSADHQAAKAAPMVRSVKSTAKPYRSKSDEELKPVYANGDGDSSMEDKLQLPRPDMATHKATGNKIDKQRTRKLKPGYK